VSTNIDFSSNKFSSGVSEGVTGLIRDKKEYSKLNSNLEGSSLSKYLI